MQYKIPQNVGIEDKIVGPLTLKQLIILAAGGGISYMLFVIMNRLYELNILEYIIIGLPAVVAASAALIKINDVSLTKFLLLTLEFAIKPKKRVWDRRDIPHLREVNLEPIPAEISAKPTHTTQAEPKKSLSLSELSHIMDSGGFEHVPQVAHEDIDEIEDEGLVEQAFFGHKPSDTDHMYWRSREAHKQVLTALAKLSEQERKAAAPGKTQQQVEREAVEAARAEMQQEKTEHPTSTQTLEPEVTSTPNQPKKRKRKRKRKNSGPVREGGFVNHLETEKPAQYQEKQTPPPSNSQGEVDLSDLKELGGDIEINLD